MTTHQMNMQSVPNESPENLISDLAMGRKGWLGIRRQKTYMESSSNNSTSGDNVVNDNHNEFDYRIPTDANSTTGNYDDEDIDFESIPLFSGCRQFLRTIYPQDIQVSTSTSSPNGKSGANVILTDGELITYFSNHTSSVSTLSPERNDNDTIHESTSAVADIDSIHKSEGSPILNTNSSPQVDSSPSTNTSNDTSIPIQDLVFVENIYGVLWKAVNEVSRMRDSKVAKARYDNQGRDQRRINESMDQSTGKLKDDTNYEISRINDPMNENIGNLKNDVDYESNDVDDEDQYLEIDTASKLTQITFNSFSALIPIVKSMLDHPERVNYDLEMNGPRIRKRQTHFNEKRRVKIPENIMDVRIKDDDNDLEDNNNLYKSSGKKAQCYMFFDQVYSITTVKALELLRREVDNILSGFPNDIEPLEIHSMWGTCQSSDEVVENSFVHNRIKNFKDIEKLDDGCDMVETIETFALKVDFELIKPFEIEIHHITTVTETTMNNVRDALFEKISRRWDDVKLEVYGSCLSGLTLGNSSDVDISLSLPSLCEEKEKYERGEIPESSYRSKLKKICYVMKNMIGSGNTFKYVTAVPYARVPVVKGTWIRTNFDICFLNEIAVVNSKLLKEYSRLDLRVKLSMVCIKAWAKWKGVSSAADNTLSSYSWMILVIFYLQCIGFIPVLTCPNFMAKHNVRHNQDDPKHCVNGLRTHFVTSDEVHDGNHWKIPDQYKDTSSSLLLAGFFNFYARVFPKHSTAISIRLGKCILQKSVFKSARLWRLCIEDPFETHFSHCPHDLGTPIDEAGQRKITTALEDTAKQFEAMFSDCSEIIDCVGIKHQRAVENKRLAEEAEKERIEEEKKKKNANKSNTNSNNNSNNGNNNRNRNTRSGRRNDNNRNQYHNKGRNQYHNNGRRVNNEAKTARSSQGNRSDNRNMNIAHHQNDNRANNHVPTAPRGQGRRGRRNHRNANRAQNDNRHNRQPPSNPNQGNAKNAISNDPNNSKHSDNEIAHGSQVAQGSTHARNDMNSMDSGGNQNRESTQQRRNRNNHRRRNRKKKNQTSNETRSGNQDHHE